MKRQLAAALTALSMITLTSCTSVSSEVNTEVIISSETSLTSQNSETTAISLKSEEDTSVAENNPTDKIIIQGQEYSQDTEYISVNLDELTDEDKSNLIKLPELKSISITSVNGNMNNYIDLFKNMSLRSIRIKTDNYKDSDFELLARTFPSCEIVYSQNDEKWSEGAPTRGFIGYADPVVSSSSAFTAHLTNVTEENCTAQTLEIYRIISDEWNPVTFTNEDTSLKINLAVDSGSAIDYELSSKDFDYANAEAGRYKAVFTCSDNSKMEMQFYMSSPKNEITSILNEDQNAAYEKALEITNTYFGHFIRLSEEYASSHTAEDFLDILRDGYTDNYALDKASGVYIEDSKLISRFGHLPGIITSYFNDFSIIYSDDNQVSFKCTVVHFHEDNPYFIWYESKNYHMVKTDDGWKFDLFQLWY